MVYFNEVYRYWVSWIFKNWKLFKGFVVLVVLELGSHTYNTELAEFFNIYTYNRLYIYDKWALVKKYSKFLWFIMMLIRSLDSSK